MPSGSFWRCGDLGFRGGSTGYRILSTTAAVTKRHTKKRHDLTTSFASHFRGRVHLFFFLVPLVVRLMSTRRRDPPCVFFKQLPMSPRKSSLSGGVGGGKPAGQLARRAVKTTGFGLKTTRKVLLKCHPACLLLFASGPPPCAPTNGRPGFHLVFFWVLAGACQRHGVGGFLLCNFLLLFFLLLFALAIKFCCGFIFSGMSHNAPTSVVIAKAALRCFWSLCRCRALPRRCQPPRSAE